MASSGDFSDMCSVVHRCRTCLDVMGACVDVCVVYVDVCLCTSCVYSCFGMQE